MDLKKINSTVNLKCCSQDECLQNTEYFCPNCQKDFCLQCQLEHTTKLDTKHHNITLYRNKIKHGSSTTETCKIHSGSVYKKFCKTCNIPFVLNARHMENTTKLIFHQPGNTCKNTLMKRSFISEVI